MKRSTRALVFAWTCTFLGASDLAAALRYYDYESTWGVPALMLGAIWFLIAEVRVWRERVL